VREATAHPRRQPRRIPIRLDDELVLAALFMVGITAVYLAVTLSLGVPAASGLFGHSLGVLGFLLMVATETLYSLRKRARRRPWGRMSHWLKFHIFTGIVGPYMVFLHTSFKFQGLAGVTLLLTGIVVASGFFGRYIYTAVPRTPEGAMVERLELDRRLETAEAALRRALPPTAARRPRVETGLAGGTIALLGRAFSEWGDSWRLWNRRRRLDAAGRAAQARMDALIQHRDRIERQIRLYAAARRLMALWHTFHVPLGLTMFSVAIMHIGAAIYFATLLR
jgi:hypothetical protein